MTLFDMAAIADAIEQLTKTKVDVTTRDDLAAKIRCRIVAEPRPL